MIRTYLQHAYLTLGLFSILTIECIGMVTGMWFIKINSDQAKQATLVMNLYQQIQMVPNQEDALATKYIASADPALQAQFENTAAKFDTFVQHIEEHVSHRDQMKLQTLIDQHHRYMAAAERLFAAINTNQIALASNIDQVDADPAFHAMLDMLDGEADAAYATAGAAQANLDTAQTRTWVAFALSFGISYLLLALLLRRHSHVQRQLDAAKRHDLERLEQAALTDPLTGLGNHRAYQEDITRELQRAQHHDIALSLALIDVDAFKSLNDTNGHAFGDHVLQTLGVLLHHVAGTGQAYRIGGDEFALMLPHVACPQATLMLESIRQAAQQQLSGATLSIGLTTFAPPGSTTEDLREEADAALYEAKRRGRNTLVSFDEVRDTVSLVSAQKIQALYNLIAGGKMSVVFQPIWDIYQQRMFAVEALSRPDPSFGLAGPQEAFDIAERIGHEAELDLLCFQAILRQGHQLPPGVLLFLNLCPRSLLHPQLQAECIAHMVKEAGLHPRQVVIEITERAITRVETLVKQVNALKAHQFQIALDDTGAGNSGLELLSQLAVDFVKIDRGILVQAMQDKIARGVLAGIVAIAFETESQIIAEGVENEAMLDLVLSLGTQRYQHPQMGVQGYLLGKPSATIETTAYPLKKTHSLEDVA